MNKERQKHEFYRKLLTEYYFTYNLRTTYRMTPLGKSPTRNAIGTTTSGANPIAYIRASVEARMKTLDLPLLSA